MLTAGSDFSVSLSLPEKLVPVTTCESIDMETLKTTFKVCCKTQSTLTLALNIKTVVVEDLPGLN